MSGLLSIAERIKARSKNIPSTIYLLFQSVINARKAANAVFQQDIAERPDPEIEKRNASHKHFIDVLRQAFEVLESMEWLAKGRNEDGKSEGSGNLEDVVFSNVFSSLNLGVPKDDGEENHDASDEEGSGIFLSGVSHMHQRKLVGKATIGKRKKERGSSKSHRPCLRRVLVMCHGRTMESSEMVLARITSLLYICSSKNGHNFVLPSKRPGMRWVIMV